MRRACSVFARFRTASGSNLADSALRGSFRRQTKIGRGHASRPRKPFRYLGGSRSRWVDLCLEKLQGARSGTGQAPTRVDLRLAAEGPVRRKLGSASPDEGIQLAVLLAPLSRLFVRHRTVLLPSFVVSWSGRVRAGDEGECEGGKRGRCEWRQRDVRSWLWAP